MDTKGMQGVEAGGYLFLNGEDAALAEKERKQVEYLEKKLDFQKPEQILAVYQKLIGERSFKTPVGMFYLKEMQEYLMQKSVIRKESIPFIPVDEPCDRSVAETKVELKSIKEAARRKKERQASNFKISVVLNIGLIIGILIMFWMTMQSDTPNMINYKSALENKYASWEQELTEREKVVREKELALKVMDN